MSFNVTVQPSGRVFSVESGETVLAAAIRHGIGLPYGCKDGACSTCKCKKISGDVTHGNHQTKALSAEEESSGLILACCATAQSDLVIESHHVTDESAFPIKRMPVRITSLARVSHDVMVLRLQLPAKDKLNYHAGQYVDFLLGSGAKRSYSMASSPHLQDQTPGLELHIRHSPGGTFTDHVFSAMKEKEILRIEGPYGSFFLREDSKKPIILLASGTGFAPIKALLEHMQFKKITRPTTLYWGGRRPQDLYMHEWMQTLAAQMPNVRYVPVVSDALPEDAWSGRSGLVHQAVLQDFPDLSGYQVYACGAPVVVGAAKADYTALAGLPEDEFYADPFVTAADKAKTSI